MLYSVWGTLTYHKLYEAIFGVADTMSSIKGCAFHFIQKWQQIQCCLMLGQILDIPVIFFTSNLCCACRSVRIRHMVVDRYRVSRRL